MISAIYWLGVFAALLINTTALAAVVFRAIPLPATALAAGIGAVCTALFAVEHFIGLGDLSLALIPITAASAYLLWLDFQKGVAPAFRETQLVFLAALAFAALFRLASPEIAEDNDRLTDLHLVANYMAGARLPPLDYWFPTQSLDYYYAFQQYAAALLGRFMRLSPGASFNIAAIVLSSLVVALAWEFLSALRLRLSAKLLCIAALVIGGTGVSPLFHLITAPTADPIFSYGSGRHALLYNSRFVGWFENAVASDLWRAIAGSETARAVLLPIETFGYQYPLGGYHAPLSGFLLLFLALAPMAWIPQLPDRDRPRLEALLGATVPLAILCNAWVFPLQAALVGGWKLWDWRMRGRGDPLPMLGGAVGCIILLMPALAGLAAETGYAEPALVEADARTPIVQFLLMHWPLLVLAAAIPLAGLMRSLGAFFALLFLALLVLAELFNVVDNGYSGEFIRFNPALKWWGWIFTGGVFTVSAYLLAKGPRSAAIVAAVVLALTSTFAFDSLRFIGSRALWSSFDLNGTGAYAANSGNARIIEYLSDAPFGIVLENVYQEPPLDTGIYGSFSVKPSVVGIPWVINVWQRALPDLPHVVAEVGRFYRGESGPPLRFLSDMSVRYVVWSARENDQLTSWSAIDAAIGENYRWVEFSANPERHIGLWVRRDAAAQ